RAAATRGAQGTTLRRGWATCESQQLSRNPNLSNVSQSQRVTTRPESGDAAAGDTFEIADYEWLAGGPIASVVGHRSGQSWATNTITQRTGTATHQAVI